MNWPFRPKIIYRCKINRCSKELHLFSTFSSTCRFTCKFCRIYTCFYKKILWCASWMGSSLFQPTDGTCSLGSYASLPFKCPLLIRYRTCGRYKILVKYCKDLAMLRISYTTILHWPINLAFYTEFSILRVAGPSWTHLVPINKCAKMNLSEGQVIRNLKNRSY